MRRRRKTSASSERMLHLLDPNRRLSVEHGRPRIGDIMEFDVSNEKIHRELGLESETDFWGTLGTAMADVNAFLGESRMDIAI